MVFSPSHFCREIRWKHLFNLLLSAVVVKYLLGDLSVKNVSWDLSVCPKTSCCFLLCVFFTTSSEWTRRQKHFAPDVPLASQNNALLIHFQGWLFLQVSVSISSQTYLSLPLCFLSCLLFSFSPRAAFYISVFYWRHGAVCAASLLSSKGIALWLFSVSQAAVWYENKADIYDEPHRDYLLKILIDFICHLL